MSFSTVIKRILYAGVQDDTETGLRKKIRMTNEMAMIFTSCAILYMIIFIVMKAQLAGYLLVGFAFLFLSVTYLNHLRFYTAAKLVLILSLYTGIIFISALLGPSSLVDVIFVSILAVPFAITDRSDAYLNGISLGLSILLYSLVNFTDALTPYNLQEVNAAIQYPVMLFIFLMPFVVMSKCRKLQYQYEDKLQVRTSEINLVNNQLVAANNSLEETVESLKESMKERDVLLKEVHHRVKNNMQIISSLLSLQSGYVGDEKVKAIFHGSQLRISSMAMVHEMLYRSDDLSGIEVSEYVGTLVPKLICSFKGVKHKIRTELDVPALHMNIDTAVPLGLIINEIVTNSIKHGFEGREEGTIFLSIRKQQENQFVMKIGDNGKGVCPENGLNEKKTLGFMLIEDLVGQLNGRLVRNSEEEGRGLVYHISFREEKKERKKEHAVPLS